MESRPGLIDLGVYSYQAGPEPLPEASPGPERPRPIWARLRRWWLVALAMVLVWPLGGAAAAAPALVPLWTAPDGLRGAFQVAVGDSDLYAVVATGDGPVLTAYRLADGSVRWESPLVPAREWAGPPSEIGIALVDGLLVLSSHAGPELVAVFDPETAQLRWTAEGYPHPFGAGLVALYAPAGYVPRTSLEIRELDSGAVVMSLADTTQRLAHEVSPDGPPRLVGLAGDGRLTSYDVATGTVLRRVSTPYAERLQLSSDNGVTLVHDLVVVDHHAGAESELAAYDLATLAPLWTIRDGSTVAPCGPVLCVQMAASGGLPTGLQGVDPDTGMSRWSISCSDFGMAGECFLDAWELGLEGRLVLRPYAPVQDDPIRQMFLDSASGRLVTAATEWEVVAWQDSGLLLNRGEGTTSDGVEYRREEDITPHRVWWARSDLDLERIELLGVIEADWCTRHDPYLVCYTDGEPFEVWRFSS